MSIYQSLCLFFCELSIKNMFLVLFDVSEKPASLKMHQIAFPVTICQQNFPVYSMTAFEASKSDSLKRSLRVLAVSLCRHGGPEHLFDPLGKLMDMKIYRMQNCCNRKLIEWNIERTETDRNKIL